MEILYLLIPLSAVLVLAIIGVFGWALWRGQFDDLEHEGQRILELDRDAADRAADPAARRDGATAEVLHAAPPQAVDDDQSQAGSRGEQSPPEPDSRAFERGEV